MSNKDFLTGLTEEQRSIFFAHLLQGLWRGSVSQGLSSLGQVSTGVSVEDCTRQLQRGSYVDYYNGRVIKVSFTTNGVDGFLYDRDRGQGAFQRIFDGVRTELGFEQRG